MFHTLEERMPCLKTRCLTNIHLIFSDVQFVFQWKHLLKKQELNSKALLQEQLHLLWNKYISQKSMHFNTSQ